MIWSILAAAVFLFVLHRLGRPDRRLSLEVRAALYHVQMADKYLRSGALRPSELRGWFWQRFPDTSGTPSKEN